MHNIWLPCPLQNSGSSLCWLCWRTVDKKTKVESIMIGVTNWRRQLLLEHTQCSMQRTKDSVCLFIHLSVCHNHNSHLDNKLFRPSATAKLF